MYRVAKKVALLPSLWARMRSSESSVIQRRSTQNVQPPRRGDAVELVEVEAEVLDRRALGLGPERHAERCGHAECGRTAHRHARDRDADALVRVADEQVADERQPTLVDHPYRTVLPPDGGWDVVKRHS